MFLDLKSFKWIVPCFVPSVLSDLAVKPAETIVSLVLYEENRGKEMISRIIQREDLTSKSLPCYYRGTSKSAYVATQHDNCSTHLFLKSFYMWYMLKEPRREGLLTPFFLTGSELEIRGHLICVCSLVTIQPLRRKLVENRNPFLRKYISKAVFSSLYDFRPYLYIAHIIIYMIFLSKLTFIF